MWEAAAVEKLKDADTAPNELLQEGAQDEYAVDLTDSFKELKGKTFEEKRRMLAEHLQKLQGAEFETQDGKIIAVREAETEHIGSKAIKRGGTQTKRAISAISELEAVARNAAQTGRADVDDSHNTSQAIKDLKANVREHLIFTSTIQIDGDIFDVILTTNKLKDETNPKRSFLYEVYVKRGASSEKSSPPTSLDSSIEQNPVDVKHQSRQGSFDRRRAAIRLTGSANRSTLGHEVQHFWLDTQFSIWSNGQGTPEFNGQFGKIAGWLGITAGQRSLTREQHEKFARGWEAYRSGQRNPGNTLACFSICISVNLCCRISLSVLKAAFGDSGFLVVPHAIEVRRSCHVILSAWIRDCVLLKMLFRQ
jgi:hypothetical protein